MADITLNVSATLARAIQERVGQLGRAAGVSTGTSGTTAGNGFVGKISVSSNSTAGQRIVDEIAREFGPRIAQQSGLGSSAAKLHDEVERASRFGIDR